MVRNSPVIPLYYPGPKLVIMLYHVQVDNMLMMMYVNVYNIMNISKFYVENA